MYADAKEKMANKNWDGAIEALRGLEAAHPYGVYAEQAQLDTIFIYYMSADAGLVSSAVDRFVKLHPTHSSVDYTYYLKGLVSFEEDKSLIGFITGKNDLSDRDSTNIQEALTAFEQVYTLYPDSQYAPDSRRRAKYLRNAMSKNEISIAQYYYSRNAHVAAVNRARGVVENYSSTPAVEDALGIMMFSYTKMGLPELATDSRRVLELNYPKSDYLVMAIDNVKFGNQSGQLIGEDEDGEGWFASMRSNFSKMKGWFSKEE